ncbi:hypothetical protein [Altericroceibacterium endophyticum]|uniref:Uncharacterized protein n=1 Tax=Altericroceibacterium endophyticum TaxID=1808508 RepID=A0A6I4T373_9SPHN|nr:hypothetical protein [Altericroceibacterium endophyticum]MXO64553.1 hypothetical protein [Altericroceibacterium endophyticum]
MLDALPYSKSTDTQSISDEVIADVPMASPSMRQDWNKKLEVYLRLNALLKANIAFGPMALIAAAAEQEAASWKSAMGLISVNALR